MLKYLLKRVLYGIGAICVVIAIVMIMIYSLLDRTRVFAQDAVYNKTASNQREVYRNTKWEEFGYLDFVPYTDYMQELVRQGARLMRIPAPLLRPLAVRQRTTVRRRRNLSRNLRKNMSPRAIRFSGWTLTSTSAAS